MPIYARIANGIVAEPLFTPPGSFTIADCFAPGLTWVDVTNITPQPQEGWSATVTGSAWTFTAPASIAPTLAEQATAMLAGGCQITSTSSPALSGTYACDAQSQIDIQAEVISILLNNAFTNGASSLGFPDTSGATHSFTVAQFKAFATALGAFIGALKPIMASNSGTLPSQPSVIA